MLTAQTALYAAQQSLVTARLNQLTSQVDLYRALGGGWKARSGDAPRSADTATGIDAAEGLGQQESSGSGDAPHHTF